jgi:hypothetical protein
MAIVVIFNDVAGKVKGFEVVDGVQQSSKGGHRILAPFLHRRGTSLFNDVFDLEASITREDHDAVTPGWANVYGHSVGVERNWRWSRLGCVGLGRSQSSI